MVEKTDSIQRRAAAHPSLDAMDRKILGVLVDDATVSYAELGRAVGLSAPAAHERVKRLRQSGTITGTSVRIDPEAVGKPLLAFVHVDTSGWGKSPELMAIARHPEVEEIHSVAGDTCMLLKVRAKDTHALEGLLAELYATPGVVATRSYVVLTTYFERPVQPAVTGEWKVPEGLASKARAAAHTMGHS
ncbi:Lrp/AsnC family transcriptional regulator [Nitratireductor luteus]|uniref:Lrp/AsnC family transcriptional regulator n=1 Tax=Nitratireductor luteus TaxID=2976980 RepID=UPI002240179C|nr:Lrp/AsnC family transcriptional regulator [Nitratireductor luteus]